MKQPQLRELSKLRTWMSPVRTMLSASLWGCLLLVFSGSRCAAQEQEKQPVAAGRPNIIFLMTDDQRADTLGCMGNKIIQTPHIDQLAREGMVFENAFVTTAICMTNRACVLSGQYAARHGITVFNRPFQESQLAATYPARLKQAGYYLGFVGKWGVGEPPENLFHYNQGFAGQGKYYLKRTDGSFVHRTEKMGDESLEFLDRASVQDKPFCLSVSFKAPHVYDPDRINPFQFDPKLKQLYAQHTFAPPKLGSEQFFASLPPFLQKSMNRMRWEVRFSDEEKYQRSMRGYYRLISGVDLVVGRIREKLKQQNLARNTILIFTSDHGFYLGERGFAGKWFGHDLSIRIPLVIFDPTRKSASRGVRRKETVLAIDYAPTILAMAGLKPSAKMQGRSLLPILAGEKISNWRTEFFYEHRFPNKYIPQSEGVRTQGWKYLRYVTQDPVYEELYDLSADPDEANNLAGDTKHAKQLEQMRQKWNVWRKQVK